MFEKRALIPVLGAAGLALAAFSAPVFADGEPGGMKDAPAEEGRKLVVSFTAGATTDYVFRGVSQTQEEPTLQGSIDATYGLFYAGVWASGVDFADAPKATAEIDIYAGIKPVWNQITFDLGVIYYAYPVSAQFVDFNLEPGHLDYTELKAGYSYAVPYIPNLTAATTFYWSPNYLLESGDVYTSESTLTYTLPAIGIFTPSISGLYGYQTGDSDEGFSVGGTTDDAYQYWNVGISLAVEKFTFDFRYHDTDIAVNEAAGGGVVCATPGTPNVADANDLCDERFVFTGKITLP